MSEPNRDDTAAPDDQANSEPIAVHRGSRVERRRIAYGLNTWFRTPPRRHGEVLNRELVTTGWHNGEAGLIARSEGGYNTVLWVRRIVAYALICVVLWLQQDVTLMGWRL